MYEHDYPEDYDQPPARPRGVAPAWRTAALVEAVALLGLVLIAAVLGVALTALKNNAGRQGRGAAPPGNWPPGNPFNAGPNGMEEPEPPDPPYPLQADLKPADKPNPKPGGTLRDRFLALGQSVWVNAEGSTPAEVAVSPDGQSAAYLTPEGLVAGPVGNPQLVGRTTPPGGPAAGPGGRLGAYFPLPGADHRPAWAGDGGTVWFADEAARLQSWDARSGFINGLSFRGRSPAAIPSDPQKVLFVRSRPAPKAETPGSPAPSDPVEVVLGDLATGEVRVLVPAGPTRWSFLAASPDGKRLALVGESEARAGKPIQHQLYLLDLDPAVGGPAPVPRPLPVSAGTLGTLCWSADGPSLVYARFPTATPPDQWETQAAGVYGPDLFEWDLAAERETRLSRGGGFFGPSLDRGGNLFFTTRDFRDNRYALTLRSMTLAAARDFAAREPELPTRDAAAWAALVEDVLKETGVEADGDGERLTPDLLARVADAFARLYRQRFRTPAPADLAELDRQRQELRTLAVPRSAFRRMALVVGAVEGEFVRRQHGAEWHLAKGPLTPRRPPGGEPVPEDDDPFAQVFNPFQAVEQHVLIPTEDEAEDTQGTGMFSLAWTVQNALGRPTILANDPAAAKAAVAMLADPDLERAKDLFKEGKADEAESLVLKLLKHERHRENTYLALHCGRLLYEQRRLAALRKVMEPLCVADPQEAAKYNLLGLALLQDEPAAAAEQFKNALRCNLYFSPGYLNLSEAYARNRDPHAAALCLRRLLKLMPYGTQAEDARQRLTALEDRQPGAP